MRIPADITIRQSDGLMAAVADSYVWTRSIHSQDDWHNHRIDVGDSTINVNLSACAFDAVGRLWVWDGGHVRTMFHSRNIADGIHAFSVGWTMPEEVDGTTVNRENVNCMSFDQRGGSWAMALGDDVIRGVNHGDTIITGARLQINGQSIDIAGG